MIRLLVAIALGWAVLLPPFSRTAPVPRNSTTWRARFRKTSLHSRRFRRPKNIGMPRTFPHRRFRRPNAESRGLASWIAAPQGICYWCPSPSTIRFATCTGIPLSESNFNTTSKGG
jgi:hypothetical protein